MSRGLILCYHRVCEPLDDPFDLCVSPERFAEHLAIIRSVWEPIALSRLVSGISHRSIPDKSIAVTFDDGYQDNLTHAKPLLEYYDVPATIYISQGYLGQSAFWWDELNWLVRTSRAPNVGKLAKTGTGAKGAGRCEPGEMSWDKVPIENEYLTLLHKTLRDLDGEGRKVVLNDMLRSRDTTAPCTASRLVLSEGELAELAACDLVEIGSHTVTHPVMSRIGRTMAMAELMQSKTVLQSIVGRPVTSFSYPYGAASDYTSESADAVAECGYTSACTTQKDIVWHRSDPYALPRLVVGNWDAAMFMRLLESCFDGT